MARALHVQGERLDSHLQLHRQLLVRLRSCCVLDGSSAEAALLRLRRRYTHYFYRVLKADYTFPAHRLNDVPLCLYFMTHAYFMVRRSRASALAQRCADCAALNCAALTAR